MPIQKGVITIDGTIGDLTFYESKHGNLVKKKTRLKAASIATNPNFDRFRENQSEFGRAGSASKMLRREIKFLLKKAKDGSLVSRLTTEFLKVVKSDPVSDRGMRTVTNGNSGLLKGFEFNNNARLSTSIQASYSATIDRVSGELTVGFAAFIPSNVITAPLGATHFKIVSAGLEIDFDNETMRTDHNEGAELPLDNNLSPVITQVNNLTANSVLPLFLLLGIQFSQLVNGKYYPLNNGSFNALSLVEAGNA